MHGGLCNESLPRVPVLAHDALMPVLRRTRTAGSVCMIFLRAAAIVFPGLCAFAAERVVINEIHYDPKDKRPLEFVELHNAGDAPAKLDGWRLDKFVFSAGTVIAPGGFLVVAQDTAALEKEFGVKAVGPFVGKLSNEGEKLTLANASGQVVEAVDFGAGFPWPSASAGLGSSLERIHPLADAARPGHWRASGFADAQASPAGVFIPAGSTGWKWMRGDSEPGAWTAREFKEDGSWSGGKAGFGYGDDDDATIIPDMQGRYSSAFFRHRFSVAQVPPTLSLALRVDDGCVVWVNGHEVARLHVSQGPLSLKTVAQEHEAGDWEEVRIENVARFLTPGENVLTVQAFNSALDSSDLSMDASLALPGLVKGGGRRPTPGAVNSVAAASAPPACAWVQHKPERPKAGEPVVVSVAVTDREGVKSATLHVQFVEPGAYVRRSDPDYATRWQDFPMNDGKRDGDNVAGDNVWSVTIPAAMQTNRRLVRYRVTAVGGDGATVRLPYADDPSPNFAYYVWNGVPAWTAASQPGTTPPVTFAPELQNSLPIFTLIANATDVQRSQYDGGQNHRKFSGTFVHDGQVIDHMEFHNRGSASTYVAGKNKWGFKFAAAHELEVRDQWGRKRKESWNSFSMNACASPWVQVNRGMSGLDEAISFRAYQLAGVPASDCQPVHFRVVTTADEQGKTQYDGDLWGLYQAIEDVDGAWLKNQKLADGITISPERGVKHVPGGYSGDAGQEWGAFTRGPQGDAEKWWRANMDLRSYYGFHAINRLVSNIDLRPGANHCFYRNPERGWAPVPWDLDMQFIPCTHQPGFIDQARVLEVPALRTEFRNRAREILDLLASDPRPVGGQIGQLVAEYARLIEPVAGGKPLGSWAELDRARWNFAPPTSDKGAFFRNPAGQGMQGGAFSRTLATPDFAGFCKYIVDFCTDTRPQKNYAVNDKNPLGYGWGYLSLEAADKEIPARPTIRYVGPAGFPAGALGFECSPFSDPQGAGTFGAIMWRVGEIATPAAKPWRYEIEPIWESAEAPAFVPQVHIPQGTCKAGRTYRVRVRHRDNSGRWSHWSEAVEFVAK